MVTECTEKELKIAQHLLQDFHDAHNIPLVKKDKEDEQQDENAQREGVIAVNIDVRGKSFTVARIKKGIDYFETEWRYAPQDNVCYKNVATLILSMLKRAGVRNVECSTGNTFRLSVTGVSNMFVFMSLNAKTLQPDPDEIKIIPAPASTKAAGYGGGGAVTFPNIGQSIELAAKT